MDRREFFERVFGPSGYISIRGLMADKSAVPALAFFTDFDTADNYIQQLQDEGRELYFSCATFKTNVTEEGKRAKANYINVHELKSFFIDVDCGPSKRYKTQKEGLEVLRNFCQHTGLPRPTLVSSGNGIHAYWILSRPLPYNEWKKLGLSLKQKTIDFKCEFDNSVTGDGAQILRIPDTFNTKDKENPKPVVVIYEAPDIEPEEFARLIPPVYDSQDMVKAPLDEMTKNLMGSPKPSKFAKIMRLSAKKVQVKEPVKTVVVDEHGNEDIVTKNRVVERSAGCPQLLHAYEHRATLDEPLWWAALSVAQSCIDRDQAVLKMSEGHPEFDPHASFDKAAHSKGPRTCKEYQLLDAALCANCIHKDKISSPIQLGQFVELAKAEDSMIEDVWHDGLQKITKIEAPTTYPYPWVRAKGGGVAYIGKPPKSGDDDAEPSDDDEDNVQLVYNCDLWVKERVIDPNWEAMVRLVLIQPQDGVQEFDVPLSHISKKEKCQEVFAKKFITALDHRTAMLQRYLMAWVDMLSKQDKATMARSQFGWFDNNTCVVIGNREIRNTGDIIYSPSSSLTERVAPLYDTRGSLAVWKSIADHYNKPGNEARAFALCAGFGSVLYNFLNMGSMIIHLTNSASGVGKSTIQRVIASIWGHPKDTMLNNNDTRMAKQHRFGVLNHFPLLVDEITNMIGEEMSEFAFSVSENRGRNRMQSQVNAERENESTWNSLCFTSGNNSLYDTLRQFRKSVEGELYRILELPIDRDASLSKEESDYLFDQLLPENYGVAGEVFLLFVVAHLDKVRERLLEVQKEIDKLAGFAQKDRFYSACCAAAFTGGEIAVHLGLVDLDLDRIKQWAIDTLGGVQETVQASSADDASNLLGLFINANYRNMLIVNGSLVMTNGLPMDERALKDVSGNLTIRVEVDAKKMFIDKAAVSAWCASERVSATSFINTLHKDGILIHENFKKNLSERTMVVGAPVWTLVLDTTKMDSLSVGP